MEKVFAYVKIELLGVFKAYVNQEVLPHMVSTDCVVAAARATLMNCTNRMASPAVRMAVHEWTGCIPDERTAIVTGKEVFSTNGWVVANQSDYTLVCLVSLDRDVERYLKEKGLGVDPRLVDFPGKTVFDYRRPITVKEMLEQ